MGQSWHEQWCWEPDVGVASQPARWVEINPRAKVQTLEFGNFASQSAWG